MSFVTCKLLKGAVRYVTQWDMCTARGWREGLSAQREVLQNGFCGFGAIGKKTTHNPQWPLLCSLSTHIDQLKTNYRAQIHAT